MGQTSNGRGQRILRLESRAFGFFLGSPANDHRVLTERWRLP